MTRAFAAAIYAGLTVAAAAAITLTAHTLLAVIRMWRATNDETGD